MTDNRSPKELVLNQKLAQKVKELVQMSEKKYDVPERLIALLLENKEVEAIQDYANTVSITRLGFNDHGPVHMRTVCLNSLKLLELLKLAGVQTSLEAESHLDFCDSITAVILASFIHDSGMTVTRQDHELFSGILCYNFIHDIVDELLPGDENLKRRVAIRSTALEGIIGHMGSRHIYSLEAGLVQIADGCDMTKGRARIPLQINSKPVVGDIHKYSANSIDRVVISKGKQKPIGIEVHMSSDAGFFQVEEVLLQKINSSPAKQYVELSAGLEGQEMKPYL